MESQVKTKEDKKREILVYLEENSKNGDILALRRQNLIPRFSDGHHTEETIEEIVEELVKEEPVSESKVELNLIYTDKHEEHVFSEFDSEESMPLKGTVLLGLYTFSVLVIGTNFLNNWLSNATNTQILLSAYIGTIFTLIVGNAEQRLQTKLENKIPIIHKHKELIYPTLVIFSLELAIAFIVATFYSSNIPTTALVSIPGTSVLGGAAVARYWRQEDNNEKVRPTVDE